MAKDRGAMTAVSGLLRPVFANLPRGRGGHRAFEFPCAARLPARSFFTPYFYQISTGPRGTGIACRAATAGSCMNEATIGGGR